MEGGQSSTLEVPPSFRTPLPTKHGSSVLSLSKEIVSAATAAMGPSGAKPEPEQGWALHPPEEFLEFSPTTRGSFNVLSEEEMGAGRQARCCLVAEVSCKV